MANSNTSRSMRSVGDAGPDLGDQHVEAFGREPAGLAHALEGGGPWILICPVLRSGALAAST